MVVAPPGGFGSFARMVPMFALVMAIPGSAGTGARIGAVVLIGELKA